MIAYLDSSTILRIILGQDNALKEWDGLVMATHDDALATAARASGMRVLGVSR